MSSAPPTAPTLASELAFARQLLGAEAAAVSSLAARLGDSFPAAVSLICACADNHGTVLVTGLGKSGLIGQKISATLASLGITSHFVHPAEAAHGDLGRFRAVDLCIALSYSGETDEVVDLAAILRQDNVPIISITRGRASESVADNAPPSPPSSLDRLATAALSIGPCDDASISPAPMCSTTAMLALGDALAACAARRRNFTDDDFAKRHPGGALGELMKPITAALRFTVPATLRPVPDDVTLAEALKQSEISAPGGGLVRRTGATILIDRATGRLTGLFTDGDLRRVVERDRHLLDAPIATLMTKNPGTLPATSRIRDAVRMVREHRRDEIPIVDEAGKPVGLLDVQDLVAMRLIRDDSST